MLCSLEDEELVARAIRAFYRRLEQEGFIPTQPASSSHRDGNVILLENCNGTLARYRVIGQPPEERIRFLGWGEDNVE